jgi:HPt (histidine-containing phosphotransfer) domain-containing protein
VDKSFDHDEALRIIGNKADLFAELLEMFFEESSKMLEKILSAIKADDHEALRFAAHSMKGPLNTLGAIIAAKICHQIELMAENKESEEALKSYQSLVEEVACFEEKAKKYLIEVSAPPKHKEMKYENTDS